MIDMDKRCPGCHGSGQVPCDTCHGEGGRRIFGRGEEDEWDECTEWYGKKFFICRECKGPGRRAELIAS